ncbi:hypothetical protein [Nocardia salmonicida]|uniref:Uncharacterized protein n=1 Tax=Nocardia salmonicida TaxID=53431 RepID=A0ABZ1NEU6_9NOCA|nr:hypothetical protein [Nocardia salmonicida]
MTKTHAHRWKGGSKVKLHFLGSGGSNTNGCPSLYETDQDTFLVQGWTTDTADKVEIPHLLTGFAKPRTYLGATLTDTGRGTFTLTGRPVTEADTLAQIHLAADETAIEVPLGKREFYGHAATQ